MRTTVNIDDDVLRAVKELARMRGATIGETLSELARTTLSAKAPARSAIRNGVPVLPARPGAAIVTPDMVRHFHHER